LCKIPGAYISSPTLQSDACSLASPHDFTAGHGVAAIWEHGDQLSIMALVKNHDRRRHIMAAQFAPTLRQAGMNIPGPPNLWSYKIRKLVEKEAKQRPGK